VEQGAHFGVAALGARRPQDGHEGLRERAFGEQAAQQVGNAERHPESVGQRAGAECARDQDVADQAGNARQQREDADGGGRAEQTHGEAGKYARPAWSGRPRGGRYLGGMRIAPSRRIVSPLSMSLVMMLWTSLA